MLYNGDSRKPQGRYHPIDEKQGQLNRLEDDRRPSANLNNVPLQVWIEDIKTSLISKFQPNRISRSKVTVNRWRSLNFLLMMVLVFLL